VVRKKQALQSVTAAAPAVLVIPADVVDPDWARRAIMETVAHLRRRTCVLPVIHAYIFNPVAHAH
jgi:hypothetical protein